MRCTHIALFAAWLCWHVDTPVRGPQPSLKFISAFAFDTSIIYWTHIFQPWHDRWYDNCEIVCPCLMSFRSFAVCDILIWASNMVMWYPARYRCVAYQQHRIRDANLTNSNRNCRRAQNPIGAQNETSGELWIVAKMWARARCNPCSLSTVQSGWLNKIDDSLNDRNAKRAQQLR